MGFGVALVILSLMCDLILFIQIGDHQEKFLLHTANENCKGCRGNLISASSASGAHCALQLEPDRRSQNKTYFFPLAFIQSQEDLLGVKDVRLGLGLQAPCWERTDARNRHMWHLCVIYRLKTYLDKKGAELCYLP